MTAVATGRHRHAKPRTRRVKPDRPSLFRRTLSPFGALRRGGHPAAQAQAVQAVQVQQLKPLPAPVVSPQPSGANWEPGAFAGGADPAQQITADDAVAAAVALLMSAAPVPDGDAPAPPAAAAAANTAADYGHTTALGAPRPFAPAVNATGPFPVAFTREYGPDGRALTRGQDEQLFGAASFAGLFPAGTDIVAEVNLGSGPCSSPAFAGNSLYLRSVAAAATLAAHRYDQAVAAIAEPEAAPVVAAEPEPEVAEAAIPGPAAEVAEVTEPVPAEDAPAEPVTEDEAAEVAAVSGRSGGKS